MEEATLSWSSAPQGRGAHVRPVNKVSMSVEHPHLARIVDESVWVFFRRYDTHYKEVMARDSQLVSLYSVSTEPIRPVGLKFYIDQEKLQSTLELGMISGVADLEELSEKQLRNFL